MPRKTQCMSVPARIRYMLEHPDESIPLGFTVRPKELTEALAAARDVLDEGKMKRGLDYLVRNPKAILHFGGNDIIRPALILALQRMEAANQLSA